ncbi:organic solute transporter alpha-like protein [Macrosteles quadrilineatus]|uniref:organic solute transporter alpha-like protein n=1 Tax=Macrosteles quadrilineatus TaxID=74068 RepID=UPI0023E0F908|nr:organic solute transporter alpha-like protein [Macrosteles quadrilineatus]
MNVVVYNVSDAEVLEVVDPLDQTSSALDSDVDPLRPYNMSLVRPECHIDMIPSINDYFTAFNLWGVLLFTLGGLAVCIVLAAYCDTLRHVLRSSPPLVKTHSAIILSVYPVVALSTYCATVVPRAQLLAEAVTQGVFMAGMYQLFCLMIAYCGGEAMLISRVKPLSLSPRVGPCCCWPCCGFLPVMHIDKDRVRWLRVLVLQLPVVQGLVYMVLLVMWAEEQSLYQVNYMYLQPLVVMSILCGVWGIIMTMKMLTEVLQGYHIQGKFIVLQLVLILAKLQGVWARLFVWFGWLPCKPPITPTVYANLLYNSLMLWEMVLLCLCARYLYKRPLPPAQPSARNSHFTITSISEKVPPAPTINNNTNAKF